jgi:hypothetical protein
MERSASPALSSATAPPAEAPPSKKPCVAAVSESATPIKEAYFARLKAVMEREGALGSMLITGCEEDEEEDRDDDEEEDRDDDGPKGDLTESQVAQLRHVVVNRSRADAMDAMRKVVLQDQADDSCVMLNTSFSWHIFEVVPAEIKKALKAPGPAKFNHLFALSSSVMDDNDVWLHDHEDEAQAKKVAAALARAWKAVLKFDDATLGIDAEFTRPAVLDMLKKFKATVSDLGWPFNWV